MVRRLLSEDMDEGLHVSSWRCTRLRPKGGPDPAAVVSRCVVPEKGAYRFVLDAIPGEHRHDVARLDLGLPARGGTSPPRRGGRERLSASPARGSATETRLTRITAVPSGLSWLSFDRASRKVRKLVSIAERLR
jgi:hypothetical protein